MVQVVGGGRFWHHRKNASPRSLTVPGWRGMIFFVASEGVGEGKVSNLNPLETSTCPTGKQIHLRSRPV